MRIINIKSPILYMNNTMKTILNLISSLSFANMRLFDAFALTTSLTSVKATSFSYTTVTGFFLQDENSTNATTFDYVR